VDWHFWPVGSAGFMNVAVSVHGGFSWTGFWGSAWSQHELENGVGAGVGAQSASHMQALLLFSSVHFSGWS
jgi:hypothetical protein